VSGVSRVDFRAASHDDRSGQGEQRRILHDILHQSLLLIRRSFDAGSPIPFERDYIVHKLIVRQSFGVNLLRLGRASTICEKSNHGGSIRR
jgi:hypothetical protein